VERNGDAVTVQAENAKGETITLEGDYALVSVGRPARIVQRMQE
jgi:dihydrolipoamide dehydrogenase